MYEIRLPHLHTCNIIIGPLTSFLDADKDVSSTLRHTPSPAGARQPSPSTNDRGGVKFTEHELKVLR